MSRGVVWNKLTIVRLRSLLPPAVKIETAGHRNALKFLPDCMAARTRGRYSSSTVLGISPLSELHCLFRRLIPQASGSLRLWVESLRNPSCPVFTGYFAVGSVSGVKHGVMCRYVTLCIRFFLMKSKLAYVLSRSPPVPIKIHFWDPRMCSKRACIHSVMTVRINGFLAQQNFIKRLAWW
jgi:hypothetical protein